MQVLWESKAPLSLTQILNESYKKQPWKGSTIKTLLRRLCQKGAVVQEKREVYYYAPCISKIEYGKSKILSLVQQLFQGSTRNLVVSLISDHCLNEQDIYDLRELLNTESDDERDENLKKDKKKGLS